MDGELLASEIAWPRSIARRRESHLWASRRLGHLPAGDRSSQATLSAVRAFKACARRASAAGTTGVLTAARALAGRRLVHRAWGSSARVRSRRALTVPYAAIAMTLYFLDLTVREQPGCGSVEAAV